MNGHTHGAALIGVAPLLSIDAVEKSYGGPKVLVGISLQVQPGELVGVIGPNGSGKTTLFGIVSGQLRPDVGSVWLGGIEVTSLSASARARQGVGRTFQVPQSFQDMSVYENVLVGATFAAGLPRSEAARLAHEVLERTGFAGRGYLRAGDLPLLDRKRLELARALATRPKLLLLDEIAGGLTDSEAEAIAQTVLSIHAEGLAVLWIEHLVHVLTHTVDRLVVLGEGRVIADGPPRQTIADPAVRQIYLGLEPDDHAVGA
jgi:branched-chain amino acid transport system ATP-binding protein